MMNSKEFVFTAFQSSPTYVILSIQEADYSVKYITDVSASSDDCLYNWSVGPSRKQAFKFYNTVANALMDQLLCEGYKVSIEMGSD